MADEKVEALERLAHVHNEMMVLLVAQVQGLSLVNSALLEILSGTADRAAIRQTALSKLVDGPTREHATAVIEMLTQENPEDREATMDSLTAAAARLQ